MQLFKLSPQDIRWMRQRLVRTFRLTAVMLLISLVAHADTAVKVIDREPDRIDLTEVRLVSHPESDSERKLNPVLPIGWRRTTRGWEHVSSWTLPSDSIESLLATQVAREPALARGMLAIVSRLSPVTFAMIQILAILAIFLTAQLGQRKPSAVKAVCTDAQFSDG